MREIFKMHEEKDAIKRIQTYLHFVRDRKHPEMPMVAIDGIYSDETRNAVMAFQRLYDLEESGIVDIKTNDKIFFIFTETEEETVNSAFRKGDFPISAGSYGNSVLSLHYIVDGLRERYLDLPRHSGGKYFGVETSESVKALERIFGEEESGVVDVRLYNRMILELSTVDDKKYE